MLRGSSQLNFLRQEPSIKAQIWHYLRMFWRFSIYYGDYLANPPYKIQRKGKEKEREIN